MQSIIQQASRQYENSRFPKISILIPVYNREHLIEETLKSALSQEYPNYEVVISDNCSTDGTLEKCIEIAAGNPKVTIIRLLKNEGPLLNWLSCANFATGIYFKVLFSDDVLLKDCLSTMAKYMNSDTGFVYSSCQIGKTITDAKTFYQSKFNKYMSLKESSIPSWYMILKYSLRTELPVSPCAGMFHSKFFTNTLVNSMRNPASEHSYATGAGPDLRLYLEALISYRRCQKIEKPLVFFRDHADSFTMGANSAKVMQAYEEEIIDFIKKRHSPYAELLGSIYILANTIRKGKTLIHSMISKAKSLSKKGINPFNQKQGS